MFLKMRRHCFDHCRTKS